VFNVANNQEADNLQVDGAVAEKVNDKVLR
jgi:hypothetical protein